MSQATLEMPTAVLHSRPANSQAVHSRIRLGFVGCGAVTQQLHLPSLAHVPEFECAAFVDKNLAVAQQLAAKHAGTLALSDYADLVGKVDAVVVGLPNTLHAQAVIELLKHDLHVLVEKPMATTVADCEAMLAAARQSKGVLAVAHMRRHYPNRVLLKKLIAEGQLGELQRLEMSDGIISDWPQSLDFFRKERAGGGVIMDMGVHELDVLIWLLGEPTELRYADDNLGNVENNARLNMLFQGQVQSQLHFSRTADLKNTLRLTGSQGWAEYTVWDWNKLRYATANSPQPIEVLADTQEVNREEIYARQLKSFARSIQTGSPPTASGKDGLRVIHLVEQCYAKARQPVAAPATARSNNGAFGNPPQVWLPRPAGRMSQLQGKTVLVTGATGFIGGRLVERLILDEGAQVRALVRRPSEVRWLCQFPVQMIHSDVSDADALARAAEGCEVIFQCAATMTGGDAAEYQRGTVAGTHSVAQAALKAGVRRLVYLSTVAVYNGVAGHFVNEQSPMPPTGQLYADSKIEAEAILAKYMHEEGLPAVVLRPTMVYGPRCRWFTIEPVKKIRAGYLALVAGSQGMCDVSYVDNLVDAMFLAEQHPDALGQDFIISDGQPVLWRDFLNEYATMLGKAPLPTWSANMLRLARVLQSIRFVRRLVRKWPRMSPDDIQQQLPATRYNISKAQRVLGYVPRVSLAQGMATTRAWLEDQGFIG